MFTELNEDLVFSLVTERVQQDMTSTDELNFLDAFAEQLFERSQYFVPVVNGRLKKSGKLERKGKKRIISYTTPYAVYVHELIANWHEPPTRAKFLEDSFLSVYRELYFEFGAENIPKIGYRMNYSTEKVEMELYLEGVS